MHQEELILRSITVLEPGQAVQGPVVYSTNPKKAPALDGKDYFLKGPDLNVAVPELVAHLLAGLLGLPVPPFGVAKVGGEFYFASEEIQNRNVDLWIRRNALANPEALLETVVFDVWIANRDRNMSNFVGEIAPNMRDMYLYAIDFEKSMALQGPHPITTVPTRNPKDFWPREELGRLLRGKNPPRDFCGKIAGLRRDRVVDCFDRVVSHVGQIPWAENSVKVLSDRAKRIESHVEEVWA